jgi:hypothetical protein
MAQYYTKPGKNSIAKKRATRVHLAALHHRIIGADKDSA